MKMDLHRTATLVGFLAASVPTVAQAEAFLPPQKVVAVLADGHPWSATAPDGVDLEITLNKDGSGSIRGPLPVAMQVSWSVKGDAMCLLTRMGERCLRFRDVPGGLQGWEGDKPGLKFRR